MRLAEPWGRAGVSALNNPAARFNSRFFLIYGGLPCAHGATLACDLLTGWPGPWAWLYHALFMDDKHTPVY